MKRIVLVFLIIGGEPQALSFPSEAICWQWTRLFHLSDQDWMGKCMTEDEYWLRYSKIPLQQES